jgi:hypothetical protein
MSALIYDTSSGTWQEPQTVPQRYDQDSQARVETTGYRHDGDAWTEAWSQAADLIEGETYTFGGISWIAAKVDSTAKTAVLQSKGVTSGYWPGYTMSGTLYGANGKKISLTSANSYYTGNIDGYDISNYNTTTKNLYSSIKAAEYSAASYGKGLYLVSNSMAGTTNSGSSGSGNYYTALIAAANNYSSFGASEYYAWLGTVYGDQYAWFVHAYGSVIGTTGSSAGYKQDRGKYVVAPAFNVDTSKIKIENSLIYLK